MKYPNYRPPKNVIQLTYPVDKDTIDYLIKIHKNEPVGYTAKIAVNYTKTGTKNAAKFTWYSVFDKEKIFIANFTHKNIHVYTKILDVIPMCKRIAGYDSKTKRFREIALYYKVTVKTIKDLPK